MQETLKRLKNANIIKTDGSINSSNHLIFKRLPELLDFLVDTTSFLPDDAPRYERLYAIAHNIAARPKCTICDGYSRFLGGRGYSEFCSKPCKNKYLTTLNKIVDKNTGMSTFQKRARTASANRKKINPLTGISNYQETAAKVAAKRNKIDEKTGLTGYQLSAEKMVPKRRRTMEDKGVMIPLSQKTDYELYKMAIGRVMRRQPYKKLSNYHLRGRASKDNPNAYHLDHKFSILEGFQRNIPPYIMGHIFNLVYIPWKDNVQKSSKCTITEEELISAVLADINS